MATPVTILAWEARQFKPGFRQWVQAQDLTFYFLLVTICSLNGWSYSLLPWQFELVLYTGGKWWENSWLSRPYPVPSAGLCRFLFLLFVKRVLGLTSCPTHEQGFFRLSFLSASDFVEA